MNDIFSGIAVVLGAVSTYTMIKEFYRFKYEYRNNYGYIIFNFLGFFLIVIAFAEMTMFFGNFERFIFFDNIGVCIQLLLLGYTAMGQSEKYYLKEYSRRNNTKLDVDRIKKLNGVQIANIAVIIICFGYYDLLELLKGRRLFP